jgi:hypothetical protein
MESVKKGGRPQGKHWEYYERSENTQDGHACITYKFCEFSLYRGKCAKMEGHLANHCKEALGYVIRKYLQKLSNSEKSEETSNFSSNSSFNTKKRKLTDKTQTSLKQSFNQIEELTSGYITRINRALVKFFVCCCISFQIVENPFFMDFIKELNPSYILPSREILSGRLMEEELSKVNYKVSEELKNENNLTLG